jgi:hypothetical protein
MVQAEDIELRTNSYAKQLLVGTLVVSVVILLAFYVRYLRVLQLPLAYLLPVLLAYGLVVSVKLCRLGNGPAPVGLVIAGAVLLFGGAAFDVIATITVSPRLDEETNVIARALLDSGHSVSFVYAYGLVAQVLIQLLALILWVGFLRHQEALVTLARGANPQSIIDFTKALLGGAHLTRRQFFFPLRLSELPKSYNLVWILPVMWVTISPYRWHLGLEWLGMAPISRTRAAVFWFMVSQLICSAWIWAKHKEGVSHNTESVA